MVQLLNDKCFLMMCGRLFSVISKLDTNTSGFGSYQELNAQNLNHDCTLNPLKYKASPVLQWSKVVQSSNGPIFKCHVNTGLNLVLY